MKRDTEIGLKVIYIFEGVCGDYAYTPVHNNVYRVVADHGVSVFSVRGKFKNNLEDKSTGVYKKHFMSWPDEIDRAKGVT